MTGCYTGAHAKVPADLRLASRLAECVGAGVAVGRVSGSGRRPLTIGRSVWPLRAFCCASSSSRHRERHPSLAPRLSRASVRKRTEASRSDTGEAHGLLTSSRPPSLGVQSVSRLLVAQWKRAFRRRSVPSYARALALSSISAQRCMRVSNGSSSSSNIPVGSMVA